MFMNYRALLLPSFVLPLLSGCIEPSNSELAEHAPTTGPYGPAPAADGYQCFTSHGSECETPAARIWLPGWAVQWIAARGQKVAIYGYRLLPDGKQDVSAGFYLGQVDLQTGLLEWTVRVGNNMDDLYGLYDIAITPQGDIVLAAQGNGVTLVGDGGFSFDSILAVFDSHGQKRYAKRLEILDVPPPIDYRPHFVGARIIADDLLRVRTSFHYFPQDKPGLTILAAHIFSFQSDGTQLLRVDVPHWTQNLHWEDTHVAMDGSLWTWQAPGPMYHYAKDGALLESVEVDDPVNLDIAVVRGFVPTAPWSLLLNLSSTKGATNDIYRLDVGTPRALLFQESVPELFQAAGFRQSLGFSRSYYTEQGEDGATFRLSTIDANGLRGPTTTVSGVGYGFTLFDGGGGVFVRAVAAGSEIIAQLW